MGAYGSIESDGDRGEEDCDESPAGAGAGAGASIGWAMGGGGRWERDVGKGDMSYMVGDIF